MDTDLLIANRLNERLSVVRSLLDINTGVQNQRLVAYPVMIYRWDTLPNAAQNSMQKMCGRKTRGKRLHGSHHQMLPLLHRLSIRLEGLPETTD